MSEIGKQKCQICVGCGRCVKAESGLHVITDSFLKPELLPAEQTAGKGSFVITDIGTTTIAMELFDECGKKQGEYVCVNPQRIAGADVISRIEASQNPLVRMQLRQMVEQELEKGLKGFLKKNSDIRNMYIAGNTTMLNLLCGHDVSPLGYAPFQADFLESEQWEILGVTVSTLPGLSAFIGADIVAGIWACGLHEKKEPTLLVDLGTNGEMVLGNKDKMLACSTAAGPAFEGMLDEQRKPVWGADVTDCIAQLLTRGMVDETGLLKEPYFSRGISIGGISVTQEQIRNFQTAKAAIATGIKLLCKEYGLASPREITRIYLAGGFGYFLKEEAARKTGLLPGTGYGKVQAVGNSALAGCYAFHFETDRKKVFSMIQKNTRIINLAETDTFSTEFVNNMDLHEWCR